MTVDSQLWHAVVERDAWYFWDKRGHVDCITALGDALPCFYWPWRKRQTVICLVPLLDPGNPYPCGGKQEVDHVKDEPRMGKRAPDDAAHLVAMCQNHNTWHPPRKELRQAEREYLKHHAKGLREATAPAGASLQAPGSWAQPEGQERR